MTEANPGTHPENLIFSANMAEQYPLVTITSAGDELQRAFSKFLRDAGNSQADLLDLQADLLTLIPRLINAIVSADHHLAPCLSCSKRLAVQIATEILRDAIDHVRLQQKNGGVH